jgi:hypothetical protein
MKAKQEPPVVSNQANPEMLLIRVGHFLFKEWVRGGRRDDSALKAVYEAKRLFRAPMQASRDTLRMAKRTRLVERSRVKRQKVAL